MYLRTLRTSYNGHIKGLNCPAMLSLKPSVEKLLSYTTITLNSVDNFGFNMLVKNILQILLLFLSMSLLLAAPPRRINCRKYVFAPVCRGVAAKRLVSNLNEMLGDDPNVYAKDDIIPLQENDNQPKIDDTQGQWYMNDQRRHPDTYLEFEKKNRKTNSDYDAIVNLN